MNIDSISSTSAVVPPRGPTDRSQNATAFGDVLGKALQGSEGIRFSNHAQKRLDERNITISDNDVLRIAKSADDAMAKGSKEALLVMDRLTLVLGVPNRTVITVMEPHERENTVFTNIDSVVMVAKGVPLAQ